MASIESVRASIDANVKTNGQQKITGSVLNYVLNDMVDLSEQAEKEIQSQGTQIQSLEQKKTNEDGKYPLLTAGFANNLVGRGEAIEAEINFRPSGGKSIEDGAARVKELHGNTLVWNQHIEKVHLSAGANAIINDGGVPKNHKLALIRSVAKGECFYLPSQGVYNYALSPNEYGYIFMNNHDVDKSYVRIYSTEESGYVALIDLTLMFGKDNEPTTIEEFYNAIPQGIDLYAYNVGELISCKANGIKSVGFNAWDEEWEQGYINEQGENGYAEVEIRSKNYIPVLSNTAYYFPYYLADKYGQSGSLYFRVMFYDNNKNVIEYKTTYTNWAESSWIMTTPANCAYIRFYTNIGNGKYNGDICINISHTGYRNGEYQPYMQFIRDIDPRIREAFPNGLRSAGNAYDKVYNKNGKGYVEKHIDMVDLGTFNWFYGTYWGASYFYATDSYLNEDAICGRYSRDKVHSNVVDMIDKSFIVASNQVYIKDSAYTDADTFKAAMSGVMLYYELAEPEILEFEEPFNLDYEVWDFGTEEMLTSEASAPIRGLIAYGFNAVDEIRELRQMLTTLQTQIANL